MLVYSIRDGYFPYWLKGIRDALRELSNVLKTRDPLSGKALNTLREISKYRPSLVSMIKQRLLKKDVRL